MLVNPFVLYFLIWLFVLGLYTLHLSPVLEPLAGNTVVLIVGTSVALFLGWVIESIPFRWRLACSKLDLAPFAAKICSRRVGVRVRYLWTFFFASVLFEIVIGGGAPILGVFGLGVEMRYTDFGIPGFHGLVNSVFYAASILTFTRSLLFASPNINWLVLVTTIYPVLGMSRQVMISLCIQYFFVYIIVRRPSVAVALRVSFLFLAVVLIFGYLGDLRTGREIIIAWIAPDINYPDWLPSAFLWIYLYLTTPINNVNLNIGIEPNYFPLETAGTLLPSFIREAFVNTLGGSREWDLVTETFNISSLLQSLLTDFGIAGAILFMLLSGIVFSYLLRRAHHSPAALFALVVVLHGIALSFFANLLFHIVFLFEIVLLAWVVSTGRMK